MSNYRVQVAVKVLGDTEFAIGTEVVVEADSPREAAVAAPSLAQGAIAIEGGLEDELLRSQGRQMEKMFDQLGLGGHLSRFMGRLFGTTDRPSGDSAVPSAEELGQIPTRTEDEDGEPRR
jgi:hypothetical protein